MQVLNVVDKKLVLHIEFSKKRLVLHIDPKGESTEPTCMKRQIARHRISLA